MSRASIRASTCFSSASSALMRSAKLRECSTCPETSAPSRLPLATCSESLLRSAFNSSASRITRRRSASSSTICFTSSAPPLPASARSTAAGCSRISRRSSTALRRFDGCGALGVDASDRANALVGLEVDDAHAPGVASLGGDVGGVEADHLALGRDDQDVVAVVHLEYGDDGAVTAAGLDVDDPLAGPSLQPVLVERRSLAEAALGDGQDRDPFLHDVGGDDLVALVELDALHPTGVPARRAHFLLREADDHAELGRDHDLALAVCPSGRHELIVVVQANGLDAAGSRMGVRLELGLLHLALLGREQDVAARGEVAHGHARRDHLALAEREEIHHGLALGLASALGDLVDLSQWTLPRFVKERRYECVEATKRAATMSSSFVSMPVTPLPPRRWLRYASTWVRLM